ncbi:DEAD/DEAH box helicase [Lachnospiraceae bacterium MD1]|uniref:DEAD/DEAH box helicase n=1 Tax=Variimorphobacter saccharofermentans TaxID=2755051 RepID=A0A839JY67_9FIRM|nr:DEAD/DEAH box helicase [Variimorphobacter saccharofermentans]MBB2182157.1 DEAD/DEAH box helicase [Variimorphobacter saccharofermentans]
MTEDRLSELRSGFENAYIDGTIASNLAYKPQFISNNYKQGKKVLSSIEDELVACDGFQISVAFITMGGITPLLQTLKALEKKGIKGEILTTNYLNFSEPRALEKLNKLSNITLKMYDVEASGDGFHTKGYIFKKDEIYRIIIGSSNMTKTALTSNREWNTRVVSTEKGEIAQSVLEEFNELWNSEYALEYDEFYEQYKERYKIIKKQREIAKSEDIPSVEKYRLQPNSMQVGFIVNLKKIIEAGEERALLISATGTGKTYASAFAMRELGYKRVLFLVHRGQLARQTKKSYQKVFGKNISMGLVGAGYSDYEADYVFAMVQTLNRDEHLHKYSPDEFDCIILDEAHHSSADTYQKVMSYFKPKLWLGMTATPDKRDDDVAGRNIYEIFNYQIAYEIRLQQAMEEDILCPFHYFGISDVSLVEEKQLKSRKMSDRDFNLLTGDERVRHIIEQAEYYGYSGDRVKGLIFCSRIDESEELSQKFNALGYRTIALNGSASEDERTNAFERLAMDEKDATEKLQPLDYIFSVEILNEGVDIVEVNQVIMLRPTESPIVFIQQLGRGLRKAEGKEYVVILDFIGNYNNNFMIPVALSGDRSYNPDIIRKYVISGNTTIPGASTVHFDEIAKDKIFSSIDKIKGMKSIIKSSYKNLKNRLGRVPYLVDFYDNGEVDPLVIIREYKTYQAFLESEEKELYVGKISEQEMTTLEYLSKTVLSGARPYELEILKRLMKHEVIRIDEIKSELQAQYGYIVDMASFANAVEVLQGRFVSKEEEYQKYCHIDIVNNDESMMLRRMMAFAERLKHMEFNRQVEDIIEVGLRRYREKYHVGRTEESPFVLYEKYSRRDVSLLMNCGKDLSSTMYGMKRIGDDVFIFVTYHKEESADDEKSYVDGKPDYADAFEDNIIFRWDSQIGRGVDSSYMEDVCTAARKHLLVKKSDAETNFYYMGLFDVIDVKADTKKDNNGKDRDIAKVTMQMRHSVRDDLLRYLQSNIQTEGDKAV